ncbi:hypothetical protein [Flavihumibacter profundi]|jgi:hypothetical protein|uniref:hypothetical protein n=1 Tax=Flavihumibacter profundi TaxID=2716883 RepID=UPI001CC640E0|nr:hypothetical protein [Flavihumibacter profundi]MBZ5857691.1 hypothetical protein [Flavihumibacter profundi]
METTFYILLHVNTPGHLQTFGKFYIGNDKEFAHALFSRLKGNSDIDGNGILYAELMETHNDLPVNIQILSCTLGELAENCRIITKEVFKLWNLGESLP